jgi:uncharacterized membrane protein
MIRNIIGFAIFAAIIILGLRLFFGLFGILWEVFVAVLWLALVGFVIYLLIKLFSPDTARRIREMISGTDTV